MIKRLFYGVAAGALLVSSSVIAATAQDILENARLKQLERWEGVDVYVVTQSLMGHTTSSYFQRFEFENEEGDMEPVFLPVPESRFRDNPCSLGAMSDEDLATFRSATTQMGDGMATEIESGMAEGGLPPELLSATGSDPWNTMDPRVMMGGYADFLEAAAEAERQEKAIDYDARAEDTFDQMSRFMQTARLVGTETVEGREAYHLRATDLNQVEEVDGKEYHMDSISMWIDKAEAVPLKMRMDGTLVSGSESKPMTLENIQTDYRRVPGSNMYESYRQVMRMTGMLSAEEEAEFKKAQKELDKLDKEMASMSPSQRQMMENMMGDQIKMMRNIANGGAFENEVVVTSIEANPMLVDTTGQPCPGMDDRPVMAAAPVEPEPKAAAAPATAPVTLAATTPVDPDSDNRGLVVMVQKHLTNLGYDTGNTKGDMNTETIVAISQFQAENGLPVTGEVSPQLAGILAAQSSAKAPEPTPEELKGAQQACLQEKMEAAQAAQKKKRGFGSLLSGVGKVAAQMGNYDIAGYTHDIYQANSTAEDFKQAAKDLGLTEEDIAACENPL
jgi:peptidoglycan hydrolase-like protein with peptidoglycan-binding domain